jgi:hypothetical protein
VKEVFDKAALEPEAGIRALWLLYKRGKWGFLEDFGLIRKEAEPAFKAFEAENVIGTRLTKRQVRRLIEGVPGLKGAGVELRIAYALKFYSEGKAKNAVLLYRGRGR